MRASLRRYERRRAPAAVRHGGRRRGRYRRRRAVRGRRADEPQHLVLAQRGDVDPPAGVLTERARAADAQSLGALAGGRGQPRDERADRSHALVGEQVAAVEVAEAGVADHVAARDRAVSRVVAVVEDRIGERAGARALRCGRREGDQALATVPAEVQPPARGGAAHEVDLLSRVLTDVADQQRSGDPVEAEAPRIAEAVAPDLICACAARERVAGRDRVGGSGAARVGVDPQQLAEQRLPVLAVLQRVAGTTPVACGDVEVAVGPDLQLTAVVVRERRVIDRQQASSGGRVDGAADLAVLVDLQVAVAGARVHHIETAAGVVVRGEGDREQTALAARQDPIGDVEERRRHAVIGKLDPARLLDDEQPVGIRRLGGHVHRVAKRADRFEGRGAGARRAHGNRPEHDQHPERPPHRDILHPRDPRRLRGLRYQSPR